LSLRKTVNTTGPLFALAAFSFSAACDDAPLEPRELGWVEVAAFSPYAINAVCERGGILRAAGERGDAAVILLRHGNGFEVEYESPVEYRGAVFTDIVSGLRDGWAAGSRKINGAERPFMVRYAGNWPSGQWEEVDTSSLPSGRITAVYGISDEDCWLLIDKEPGPGKPRADIGKSFGLLVKYSAGRFSEYDGLGAVTAVYTDYDSRPNIFYAVTWPTKEYAVTYDDIKIFSTVDEGKSWTPETLRRDAVKGRRITRATAGGYDVDHFYIIAEFGEDGPIGILRRQAGAAGNPFELFFLSYEGPHFHDLTDVVFRKPQQGPYGFSVDGVAVGELTSVVVDDGKVFLEKMTYPLEILSPVPRGRTSGFWAVGRNLVWGEDELLYHP
jgi:hypothetical protein